MPNFVPTSIPHWLRCIALQGICEMDLEGIVAVTEQSTWFKIRNPNYSQIIGREELFERERGSDPVPGWHSCAIASTESK